MKRTELLAPAGSFEIMKAVIHAGADAVYMGLPRFSARAYSENATEEDFVRGLNYAHLRGRKIYLTLNTLMKEREFGTELYEMILPLYRAGLDAVIVQDLGLMKFLRENFPDLPIHASTQCTVTNVGGARFLADRFHISRVVPARELSLLEIRKIKDETGLELETFIHGALCYCYSGQCLFSSLVGSRSGNRGRCAQPCRMPYFLENEDGLRLNDAKTSYLLSLKDLNTIGILPKIIRAGVDSLKIEGRMKRAEYAAGVTSIYRKYLDLCLSDDFDEKTYRVSEEDQRKLFDLFNREGFSEGYYENESGRSMVTLKKPGFREHDDDFIEEIREKYIRTAMKIPAEGRYCFLLSEPPKLWITVGGKEYFYQAPSDFTVQKAENRATQKEEIEKAVGKTGDTEFVFSSLSGEIDPSVFVPMSRLNDFRRKVFSDLTEKMSEAYRRQDPESRKIPAENRNAICEKTGTESDSSGEKNAISVMVRTKEQLFSALDSMASRIELSSDLFSENEYREMVQRIHLAGKKAFYVFPEIIRSENIRYFENRKTEIANAGFDGFMIRSFESLLFLEKEKIPGERIADREIYAWNFGAAETLLNNGFTAINVPAELHESEIKNGPYRGQEMVVYGRNVMMVTKNCVMKTTSACRKQNETPVLRDSEGRAFPVQCVCRFCFNRILNFVPLNLIEKTDFFRRMDFSYLRLVFTVESGEETRDVLCDYEKVYQKGFPPEKPKNFTNGHFKHGVE